MSLFIPLMNLTQTFRPMWWQVTSEVSLAGEGLVTVGTGVVVRGRVYVMLQCLRGRVLVLTSCALKMPEIFRKMVIYIKFHANQKHIHWILLLFFIYQHQFFQLKMVSNVNFLKYEFYMTTTWTYRIFIGMLDDWIWV